MNTQEIVSRVVRIYMVARDETQEELGHALGLSRPAVTQKLSGRSKWTLNDLEVLQKHYGLTVDELLSGTILRQLGGFEAEATRAERGLNRGPRARRTA